MISVPPFSFPILFLFLRPLSTALLFISPPLSTFYHFSFHFSSSSSNHCFFFFLRFLLLFFLFNLFLSYVHILLPLSLFLRFNPSSSLFSSFPLPRMFCFRFFLFPIFRPFFSLFHPVFHLLRPLSAVPLGYISLPLPQNLFIFSCSFSIISLFPLFLFNPIFFSCVFLHLSFLSVLPSSSSSLCYSSFFFFCSSIKRISPSFSYF